MTSALIKLSHAFRRRFLAAAALLACGCLSYAAEPRSDSERYTRAVHVFADSVLKHGRDTYGPQHTPLFVDGLQVETLEPVHWKKGGQTWVLCNFASQQSLLRTLDGLTALTKDSRFREAAEDAARYALGHLRSTNGLLYWGGHIAWDLDQDRAVGEYPDVHEMKNHQAYYPLLWRADAPATRQLCEAIWGSHVLDWSLLDYNRHAKTEKPAPAQWDHPFLENTPVPFASVANNLSFALVTPSLTDAGVTLALLGKNTNALTWTRRLIYRWQQGRDPKTGLCGGQLSYRKDDRAKEALGHVYPDINEVTIVATYHRTTRYHHLPLAQMQAAEQLIAAGSDYAGVGREFSRWASEDLKTYGRYCWQPKTQQFISLLTDGTPISWEQARPGYYDSASFAPAKPDGSILWGYALAYRLTRDQSHWNMARQLAQALGLGDIGKPRTAKRSLRLDTSAEDWRCIYALLELSRATNDRSFLKLASRIADNLIQRQTRTGLFPRPGRLYARTGDEVPLAILHLAAALDGRESLLPPVMLDNAFFHCQFDGAPGWQKPGVDDKRTYDSVVFYGAD
jgi:pectate lyase